MKFSKPQKKYIIISLITLGVIAIINFSVSAIIKQKIVSVISENALTDYTASVDNVDFKLIRRSLTFKNVKLVPKVQVVSDLVENKGNENSIENITLSSLSLKGISVFKLLFSKKISIKTVSFNELFIRKIENSSLIIKEVRARTTKNPINLDSLYIKRMGGLEIENLEFVDLKYQILDIATSEVTFQNSPVSFNSSGVKLVKIADDLFKLRPSQEKFEIENINLDFDQKNYNLKLDKLILDFTDKVISLRKFSFKPTISKFELAQEYRYNDDVYDVEFEELRIYNFNVNEALKRGAVLMDSVALSGLDLKLFKDKRKPFNKNKYVDLPHLKLQKLEKAIHIPVISVVNSHLVIEEQLEDKDTLFSLSINDINAKIQNITSIPKFKERPIKVHIDAKLMNKAALNVTMSLPLKKGHETFYFSGELGKSEFEIYDAALYPVLGLKILSGEIDRLQFNAKANNSSSSGSMTMLYHNLEATVFKSNSLEKNKFLSWSVNNVIRKSNPNKKGKVKNVEMSFTRDTYKGLGNYIWKTLQSGIVKTISPTGKDVKK